MKKSTYLSLLIALVVAMFTSCGEDRTHEYYDLTEENQWIYSQMQEVYLWRDKLKEPSRNVFFSKPSKFFSTILYSSDKTSFFTDTISSGDYGITFAVMRDPIGERPNKVYALALMVEPGSPADMAGVERGTWISSVGGASFTLSKYSMLQSGGSTNLVTEYIEYDDEAQKYYWENGDTLQMAAAVNYTPKAIYLDSIYNVREKSIGYLALNNFDGDGFIQQTQDALLRFAANDVKDVVIDLRYCNGGSLTNAVSLASSFVPAELYGTPFCMLANADEDIDTAYCYAQQQATLADAKLFLIVGNRTTGTAELFTAALNKSRYMYDLLTIGEKSAGANVATEKIESPYGFAINPATNNVLLADSTLLQAVVPDYGLNELAQPERIYPLGSEQEYLLFNTLHLALNGMLPESKETESLPIYYHWDCKGFAK